ncbi:MAG: hypothetical protein KAI96_02670 [Thermodesulfovibrionia bacterium]|nr:hypothetical protein [Thermodesulfovibrionia bacterium]
MERRKIRLNISSIFRGVDTLTVEEAKKLLDDEKKADVELIDVREPQEYEEGHLPGALLIPMSELPNRLEELDPSKTVVTYCRAGIRSRSAASFMKGQGFNNVYSIKGGINAWNGLIASGAYEAGMFLVDDIKNPEELVFLAYALEDGTRLFYGQIKDFVPDEESKHIFASLESAEEKHKKTLFEIYKKVRGEEITEDSLKKEPFADFMEGGVSRVESVTWLKDKDRTLLDILEFSMHMETNSLDLYMKISRDIKDEGTKKVFGALLDDEKAHLMQLGKLLGSKVTN